jgi:hypothetical protein
MCWDSAAFAAKYVARMACMGQTMSLAGHVMRPAGSALHWHCRAHTWAAGAKAGAAGARPRQAQAQARRRRRRRAGAQARRRRQQGRPALTRGWGQGLGRGSDLPCSQGRRCTKENDNAKGIAGSQAPRTRQKIPTEASSSSRSTSDSKHLASQFPKLLPNAP